MPVVNCPIDIPEGWEFVRYGVPSGDDIFLNKDGEPDSCPAGCVAPWVIIRRARPAIEVGDWVRLTKGGFAYSGRVGRTESVTESGKARVVFDRNSDGLYLLEHLTKQARTVEPYTIDQLMVEAAKRGRHVQCGSKSTIIESIHIAGVTLSCPSIGFVSYVDATSQLTWPGGEAFGTVTWRDAE